MTLGAVEIRASPLGGLRQGLEDEVPGMRFMRFFVAAVLPNRTTSA
jgi:hypothetical protein